MDEDEAARLDEARGGDSGEGVGSDDMLSLLRSGRPRLDLFCLLFADRVVESDSSS